MAETTQAILFHRHELRKTAGGLRRHIRGEKRDRATQANPSMTDGQTGETLAVETLMPSMSAAEEKALLKAREDAIAGLPGRRPEPYAELVFGGAPRVGEGAWTLTQAREWAKVIPEWIADRFPDSLMLDCALHCDESQYHIHALMMPRARNGAGELRWGMTTAAARADALITDGAYRVLDYQGKKQAASRLQNDLWEVAGRPFGLARGKKTRGRKHKELTEEGRAEAILREANLRVQAAKEHELNAKAAEREAKSLLAKPRMALIARRERELDVREAKVEEREVAADVRDGELNALRENIRREAKAIVKKGDERARSWWAEREKELDGKPQSDPVERDAPTPKRESTAEELKRRIREGQKESAPKR